MCVWFCIAIVIYGYTPSLALGVVGAVYFGLVTLVAVALVIKLRWASETLQQGPYCS